MMKYKQKFDKAKKDSDAERDYKNVIRNRRNKTGKLDWIDDHDSFMQRHKTK